MKRTMSGWTGFGERKKPMKQQRKPECTATHQGRQFKGLCQDLWQRTVTEGDGNNSA